MSHQQRTNVTTTTTRRVVQGSQAPRHHHANLGVNLRTSVAASGVSQTELTRLKTRYEKEEKRLKIEIDELTEMNLTLEGKCTRLKGDVNVWESECSKLKLLLK